MTGRALLTVLALVPASAYADQTWVKATSANFEVYTTAGEQKAREAALYFEHVSSFLVKALGTSRSGKGRVRVIVFQSAREYKPYQPGEGKLAYAGGDPDTDQIVMQSMLPDQYFIAVHEYVHLLLKPFKHVPLWFNEGLAQVYQTLRPVGGKVIVGDLVPGAIEFLEHAKWLDLDTLCAVDHNSPYYTGDHSQQSIFYAESWLLAHMLFAGRKYGAGFGEIKRQILAGTPAEEAFQSAFGETMWHVYSDLRRYSEDGEYRGHIFDVAIAQPVAAPEIKPVTEFESGLILAVLLVEIDKIDEARQAFKKLAEQNPASPEIPEALGFAALRKRDMAEARVQFAKAVDMGSKSARMYYRYSALEGPRDRQIALLRKAVEFDPEYRDARLELGYLLMSAADYAGALAQFERVKAGDPDNAFQFFRSFATASYRTGDKERARANAKLAADAARGPEEKASVEQLVAAIEGRSPALPDLNEAERRPTIRRGPATPAPSERHGRATIEGTLDQIDCLGTMARMRITAAGRSVRLLVDKPQSIGVPITCGPQQPRRRVRIEYQPQADDATGTIGLVRVLEMK